MAFKTKSWLTGETDFNLMQTWLFRLLTLVILSTCAKNFVSNWFFSLWVGTHVGYSMQLESEDNSAESVLLSTFPASWWPNSHLQACAPWPAELPHRFYFHSEDLTYQGLESSRYEDWCPAPQKISVRQNIIMVYLQLPSQMNYNRAFDFLAHVLLSSEN